MATRELHRRHLAGRQVRREPTRSCNPATGEVLDEVAASDADDVDEAVAAAAGAFDAWSRDDAPRSASRS